MDVQGLILSFHIPKQEQIRPDSPLFFSGSCFGEAMASAASRIGFLTFYGPCGIVFNPLAMAEGFSRMLERRPYQMDELWFDGALYHSFDHHSAFSGSDATLVLKDINQQMEAGFSALCSAEVLLLSFGTSWYYRLQSDGRVVSNNHKAPAAMFRKAFTSAPEIVEVWTKLLTHIRALNPGLKVCLAVSPVKYLRDGLVEHNRSKAALITAVHELCMLPETYYFPSYELLVDVLRDYRWYGPDLAHPSEQAVEIIWKEFADCWLNREARNYVEAMNDYRRLAGHKFRFPETEQAQMLHKRKEELRQELLERYPHLAKTERWK